MLLLACAGLMIGCNRAGEPGAASEVWRFAIEESIQILSEFLTTYYRNAKKFYLHGTLSYDYQNLLTKTNNDYFSYIYLPDGSDISVSYFFQIF